jgi:hypothetical protein
MTTTYIEPYSDKTLIIADEFAEKSIEWYNYSSWLIWLSMKKYG